MAFPSPFQNTPRDPLPEGVAALPPCHANPPDQVWRSFDGVELPYLKVSPEGVPLRGLLIIVPGTDGVTGDYDSITQAVLALGFAVYGCENRTFRYGPGPEERKGDTRDWRPWVEDLLGFSSFVRAEHPGLPVFWHGHSFGGVLVLQAAAEAEAGGKVLPDGLIVHSPGFGMMFRKATFWRGLKFGLVAWLRVPWVRMTETGNMPMSDDPVWEARWKHSADRLRQGIKVRYFIQAANMAILARNSSSGLALPVLALWGGLDRMGLGGKESLRAEYDNYMRHELAGGKATLFFAPTGLHLLIEGSCKAAALEAISDWLTANTSA